MTIVDFKLPNKEIIKLKYIKNRKRKFIAQAPYYKIGRIKVDELFFEFPYSIQVAIIYHELWHYNNNLKFEIKYRSKKPWLWLFFFICKPIYHLQEFEADLHGFQMTSKKDMLDVLENLEKLIQKGVISKSHEKTHPLIEERIKRIREL